MATFCAQCGVKQSMFQGDLVGRVAKWYCDACGDAIASARLKAEKARHAIVLLASQDVIVTTTPSIDGYTVRKYHGIESVEFVIGTGLFSEITTEFADFFGARSTAFEKKLQAAKNHAMGALKYRAAETGANAVIGVDLDYAEFSGNRIALIINGTLVSIEPSFVVENTEPIS